MVRGRIGILPLDHPLALVTLALALTFLKFPGGLIDGRFWAEEATVFARDLVHLNCWQATTYLYRGSLQLLTNWSVWISLQADIRYSPLITTWLGGALQLVLAIQFGQWARSASILPTATVLGLASLLLLPGSYEVAASATNMQWVCSLCCLLMLATPEQTLRRHRPLLVAWAALCGLTGVPSCMLAPAFLARAYADRSVVHLQLGVALTLCALLQAAIVLQSDFSDRGFTLEALPAFLATIVHTVIVPVAGTPVTRLVRFILEPSASEMEVALATGLFILFGALAVAIVRSAMSRTNAVFVAVVSACWVGVSVLNIFGALHPASELLAQLSGARYFLVGSLCFLMFMMLSASNDRAPRLARASMILLLMSGSIGLAQRFVLAWPEMFTQGPSWQAQVTACRQAGAMSCDLVAWPANADNAPWRVVLPVRSRSASQEVEPR